MVYYYEKLGLFDLLSLLLTKKHSFYGSKSIASRLFEKLIGKIEVRRIDFGDIQVAANIRKKAHKSAESCLENIAGQRWARELSATLSIDFGLIVRKFFLDELYCKFEFLELALRYAAENPSEEHVIYVEREFLGTYEQELARYFNVHDGKSHALSGFCSIFLLPMSLKVWAWKSGLASDAKFDNQIVCEIDGEKLHAMFKSIFKANSSVEFVVEKRNEKEFGRETLRQLQVKTLGLTRDDYLYLRSAAYAYVACCLKHHREISWYGSRLFMIFYALVLGRAQTVNGTGNLYFVYEHPTLDKNVRNEFLRSSGNRSIIVPHGSDLAYQYYHSEMFINYDVKCLAGMAVGDYYRHKKPATDIFVKAGSYDSHRELAGSRDRNERIARLKTFKEDSVAITILSPGICDPTYSHEVRLMKLARDLSAQRGVKVFIRLKPVLPIAKYADFYSTHTAGCDSILVTFTEHELMDFLDVTDLFVTSLSSSGFDVAMRGGQVMFVDYMKEPDFYTVWEEMKEVVLTEEESFCTIMDWVRDGGEGESRAKLRQNISKLNSYLGYKFQDFESYRKNLLTQLRTVCNDHPALKEGVSGLVEN